MERFFQEEAGRRSNRSCCTYGLAHGLVREVVRGRLLGVETVLAALAREEVLVAPVAHRLADALLAEQVGGGGVQHADAEVEHALRHGDGLLLLGARRVALRSPRAAVGALADAPVPADLQPAEADEGDARIAAARDVAHLRPLAQFYQE